jgi:hypothetical protein
VDVSTAGKGTKPEALDLDHGLLLSADSGRLRTDSRSAQIEHTGHYLGQSPGVRLAASQERAVIHSNFAGCTAASGGAEPHEMIVLWLEVATIWLAADPA